MRKKKLYKVMCGLMKRKINFLLHSSESQKLLKYEAEALQVERMKYERIFVITWHHILNVYVNEQEEMKIWKRKILHGRWGR